MRTFSDHATRETIAIILAGGKGERLQSLTRWQAKPAVYFGGKYRTIDFSLSNCINSNIRRVSILTQYKSHSLNTHIQKGWSFLHPEFNEYIDLIPAQQRVKDSWYAGTADAVYQNLDLLQSHDAKYVLILAGDHIYKMDYSLMIAQHIEKNADVTVGCVEVGLEDAKSFGVMGIDGDNRIMSFTEKPNQPVALANNSEKTLASMGIYVFNREFLQRSLIDDARTIFSSHDFGKDVIPVAVDGQHAYAYRFQRDDDNSSAYWRDVGTVDAYYNANMELTAANPQLDLYDQSWPIWTYQAQLPPAKFVLEDGHRGLAVDSLISAGCIISGSAAVNSLLFNNVRVNCGSQLRECVVLPDAEIGRHCKLRKVIIDQSCRLPENTIIGYNLEEDAKKYYVSPQGVVLVSPEMLGQRKYHVE